MSFIHVLVLFDTNYFSFYNNNNNNNNNFTVTWKIFLRFMHKGHEGSAALL